MDKTEIDQLLAISESFEDTLPSVNAAENMMWGLLRLKNLKGITVIELGAGGTTLPRLAFQHGIARYVAVEPLAKGSTQISIVRQLKDNPDLTGKIEVSSDDALTYLKSCKDQSAVVVSYYVLRDDVIAGQKLLENHVGREVHSLASRYRNELCNEIYRVTPRQSITVHGGIHENYAKSLIAAGFHNFPDWKDVFSKS